MNVKYYFQLLIFVLLYNLSTTQSSNDTTQPSNDTTQPTTNQTDTPTMNPMDVIKQYKDICMPTPIEAEQLSRLQPDCRALTPYPSNDTKFYCCELDFQEKKNTSAPRRRGCISIMYNYVENNRYEDVIDFIEKGRIEQIQQYGILLGRKAAAEFSTFIKNRTKYKVYKFDCFSTHFNINFFMLLILLYLIY